MLPPQLILWLLLSCIKNDHKLQRMATINPLAMKGSINTGLNIIGAPNNAGSEILKILGTIVAFPKAFNCCDFAFQQDKIHSPRVFPVPPKKPIPNVIKIG